MSDKPKYQPWNHEEFMGSHRVRMMSDKQRWMYCFLLHESFFCSTRPYLPDNDQELMFMAGCSNDLDLWAECKEVILKCFIRFEKDGIKLLRHKRVEEDWDSLYNYKEFGKMGWEKRKENERLRADVNRGPMPQGNRGPMPQGNAIELNRIESNRIELNRKKGGPSSIETFRSWTKIVKRISRRNKSVGSLSGKENQWNDLVEKYGQEMILSATREWAEASADFIKAFKYSVVDLFLKQCQKWIDAAIENEEANKEIESEPKNNQEPEAIAKFARPRGVRPENDI